MKKTIIKITGFLCTLLMVFTFVMSLASINVFADENEVIQNDQTGIPDKGLYSAIQKALNKGADETFTKEEVGKLKSLTAYSTSNYIESLKGIENLVNLESLEIEDAYNITSLKELSGLVKLKDLKCNSGEYENISGKGKLTSLKGIENLINLERLEVSSHRITSVKELKKLTQLKTLYLSDNDITSLKGIEKLDNLEYCSFHLNYLKEKEIKNRLPKHLLADKRYLKLEIAHQRIINNLKITSPKKITKKTKKITGLTSFRAKVTILNGKKVVKTTYANKFGDFTFNKLNLKKMGGKKLKLKVSIYGKTRTISFMVKKK